MMSRYVCVVALIYIATLAYAQVCVEPAGVVDASQSNMCNCYSGYAPSTPDSLDCNVHAKCAQLTVDTTEAASHQPRRPKTTFSNDQLTIVQKVPIVASRKASKIKFVQPLINGMPGNTPGAPGADTCSYPGVLWTKTVDQRDCEDVFTAQLQWSQATMCGFVKDTNSSTSQKTILKSTLVHSYEEVYTSGKKVMKRTLSTSYLLSVSFLIQKTVDSETFAVTITDPSVVGFVKVVVVGDATYDVLTGHTKIQFITTAAWPYQLNTLSAAFRGVLPAITGIDASTVSITQTGDLSDCGSTPASDCTQSWEVSIGAPPTLCNIQGVYTFDDTLLCRDGAVLGPCVGGTPAPVQFSLNVKKTDLCAADAVDTTAENSYTLTPFLGASDSTPTFSYQTGDNIYWKLDVVDPLATLDRITFSNIALYFTTPSGIVQTDVLLDNGVNTTKGLAVGLTTNDIATSVAPGDTASLTFQYNLFRSVLSQTIAQLSSTTNIVEVTTSVTINLYYHGNQKRSFTMGGGYTDMTSTTQSRTVQLVISPEKTVVDAAPQQQVGGEEQPFDSLFDDLAGSATTTTTVQTMLFACLLVVLFVL